MERKFFLQGCLVFLFLSTGNIKISEKEYEDVKNEIPRPFSNDSRYCVIDPSLLSRVKSSQQQIDDSSENFVNALRTEGTSIDPFLQREYDCSVDAGNRQNEIRHSKYRYLQHSVRDMTYQLRNHQKIHYSIKATELYVCKTLSQYYKSNNKQELHFSFENGTETSICTGQLSSNTRKTHLKDYNKNIQASTKIASGLCPTESIPYQTFSSTQPPMMKEFYSDPPWLHTQTKNNTLLENDFVPEVEDQRATLVIDITDTTLISSPTSHDVVPSTLLASTLEGSFGFFTPSSDKLGSYSSSVLSSSEVCQETSSMESTPAISTSISSEPPYGSGVGDSDINTDSGGQLFTSNDMYLLSASNEPFISDSHSTGIIYPSSSASESSTGSYGVFSLYDFADRSHDVIDY